MFIAAPLSGASPCRAVRERHRHRIGSRRPIHGSIFEVAQRDMCAMPFNFEAHIRCINNTSFVIELTMKLIAR